MPATFSHYRHIPALNEWLFAFTARSRSDLEKAARSYESIHGGPGKRFSVKPDPDVPGFWMYCGACQTEEQAKLALIFMENQLHEHLDVPPSAMDDDSDFSDD